MSAGWILLAAGILVSAVLGIRAFIAGFILEIQRKAAEDERARAAWRAAGEGWGIEPGGRPGGKAGKFNGNGNGGAA
jgi:hypothetical protein